MVSSEQRWTTPKPAGESRLGLFLRGNFQDCRQSTTQQNEKVNQSAD